MLVQHLCSVLISRVLVTQKSNSVGMGRSSFAFRQHISLARSRHCASVGVQDVVCHEGKLFRLYKRPGQRVIIDATGRMIVRPTHLEAAVQREPSGRSNGALFCNSTICRSLVCTGGSHSCSCDCMSNPL